jgi:cell division protein FtsI/penicillin-binding protein 2
MAQPDPSTVRFSQEEKDLLGELEARFRCDSQSDAIRKAVRIAHRETSSPLLHRVKARGTDAAFFLTLAALVSMAIGYVTDVLTPIQSVQIAMVLVAMGVGILGIIELARAMNGQSEIGEFVRGVRQ